MKKVLLIDTDSARATNISRRLRLRGFETEITDSFLYALTKLEWQTPEVLVTVNETIDGMTAGEFSLILKQDSSLQSIRTVLVNRPDQPPQGSSRGFDSVLTDDDPDRIAARLARLATHGRDESLGSPPASVNVKVAVDDADDDSHFLRLSGFVELLEVLGTSLKTGRIVIHAGPDSGTIFVVLDHGQMSHVVFGGLEGAPAFRRLVSDMTRLPEISYRFEPLERWQMSTYPRSIRRTERQRLLKMAADKDDFETQEIVPINSNS